MSKRATVETLPPLRLVDRGWPRTAEAVSSPDAMPDHAPWPRISIVTPSYNQGHFIEETIRSVVLQGYPNLEYIVIDGYSTDESVEVIRKYEPWIDYWVSEKDGGQAHALNKGFDLATGQIFAYLNSDDLLTEGTLLNVAAAFRPALNQPLVVSFAGMYFGDDIEDSVCLPAVEPQLDDWLSSATSLFQPSTFWTRALHQRVGPFRENLQFCFDKEFFLRAIFQPGQYRARPDWVASRFRVHNQSKSTVLNGEMWAENRALWRLYRKDGHFSDGRLEKALRKEMLALSARRKTHAALSERALLPRSKLLLDAAFTSPRELGSRFHLGAWKKTIWEAVVKASGK